MNLSTKVINPFEFRKDFNFFYHIVVSTAECNFIILQIPAFPLFRAGQLHFVLYLSFQKRLNDKPMEWFNG
jgi:hypothetical protein